VVLVRRGVPDGEIVGKVHAEHVAASLPGAIFGTRDFAMPLQHIGSAVLVFDGLGDEPERMVTPPVLPLFFESVDNQLVYLFFLHHYNLIVRPGPIHKSVKINKFSFLQKHATPHPQLLKRIQFVMLREGLLLILAPL